MRTIEKDILTTADTAKLLGVSVRTAQLLVEGGSIPSWKTPGGHRRVYRSDVEALIEGRARPASASVRVVVLAPAARTALWRALFEPVAECAVEVFDDPYAALFAIAAMPPHAIVADLDAGDPGLRAAVDGLAANPALGACRVVAVAPAGVALPSRVVRLHTAQDAPDAIRRSLAAVDAVPAGLPFPVALNEAQRLVALERSGLVDTLPEEAFDRVTWLAAQALEAPVSLIALLTPTRQWFKSTVGLDLAEAPRSWAFCNHTILQKGVFSVEDLAADPRFANNPAVAGDLGFRFYAGAPILDGDGFPIGSLCVIDTRSRRLSERQADTLKALAAMASTEVRLRAAERRLRAARPGRVGAA